MCRACFLIDLSEYDSCNIFIRHYVGQLGIPPKKLVVIPYKKYECTSGCLSINSCKYHSDICHSQKLNDEKPEVKKLIVAKDMCVVNTVAKAHVFDRRRRTCIYVQLLIGKIDLPAELIWMIAGHISG
jgi:hypothetical protein